MPGRVRVAEAEIVARDRTAGGTRSAINNFNALHDVVRNNWWGIEALGSSFAALGGIVTAGLAVATKAAIDFETGMAGVSRTTYDATKSAEENAAASADIADQLREIAKATPVDTGRLTAIAEEAGALGVASNDIGAFSETIAQLTATTNLTDASAAQLARIGGVMNITASATSNLGSAILFAGRSTAATESEIVRFAQYLAPVAVQANASAGQLIAMSALLPSLGQRADTARTTLSRTINLMGKAIRDNGVELQTWAGVADQTTGDFRKTFEDNGFRAIQKFVEGLHRIGPETHAAAKAMEDVGIREGRQRNVLIALASAYDGTESSILRMGNALDAVDAAYQDNEELTRAYEIATSTTSAQIAILKNNIMDLGLSLGEYLLPIVKFVVEGMQDFVAGVDAMPGPLKAVIITGISLAGILGLIGAAALLLGPRVILAAGAFRQLQATYSTFAASSANASAILASANNASAGSAVRAAFAYGRMSQSERDAALAAYQASNQQKIANAVHAEAIAMNNVFNRVKEQEALIVAATTRQKTAEMAQTAALTRAKQAESQASALAARVKRLEIVESAQLARAQSLEAAGKGTLAARAYASAAATQATIVGLRAEISARQQAIIAAQADAATANTLVGAAQREIAAIDAEIIKLRQLGKAHEAAALAAHRDAVAQLQFAGATSKAATAAGLLGKVVSKLTWPLLIITSILSLTGATAAFGNAQDDAARSAANNKRFQAELADALELQRAGVKNAIQDFVLLQLQQINGIEVADRYGYSLENLNNIINGLASEAEVANFAADMAEGAKKGDNSAALLHNTVGRLRLGLQNAGVSATGMGGAVGESAEEMEELAKSAAAAKKELDELRQANDAINSALLALPGALLAQRAAAFAAEDAWVAYREALAEAADPARRIAEAEADLADARRDQAASYRDVQDAERDLSRARQEGIDALADARDAYQDAQDSVHEAGEKVLELEEELAELRSGPSVEKLTEATNKLADAHIRLRQAQVKAQDAQYMLNYLMAEGASARDISLAQLELDSANQAVANSTADLAEAQKELNNLENPDPEVIADKERELAAARRDQQKAVRDLKDAEQELSDVRKDVANDQYYKDAEDALYDARRSVLDATDRVAQAESDLNKERNGQAAKDVARAELELEEALLRQAEANVEVQKQTALSRGEAFGLGREAKALGGELGRLGGTLTGQMSADFAHFSGLLSQARADIAETGEDLAGLDDYAQQGIDDTIGLFANDPLAEPLEEAGKEASQGFWTSFIEDWTSWPMISALLRGDWEGAKEKFHERVRDLVPTAAKFAVWLGEVDWLGVLTDFLLLGIPEPFRSLGEAFAEHFKPGEWLGAIFDRDKEPSDAKGKVHGEGVMQHLRDGAYLWLSSNFSISGLIAAIFTRDDPKSKETGKKSGEGLMQSLKRGAAEWLIANFSISSLLRSIFQRDQAGANQSGLSFGNIAGTVLRNGLLGPMGGFGIMLRGLISSALEAMPDWMKGPINKAIAVYNSFIELLASKKYTIDPVSVAGKQIFPGFSMGFGFMRGLKVNYLAEGGILSGPVFAAGEAGQELVMPLDRFWNELHPLTEMASKMHDWDAALAALVADGGGNTYNNITVNVETGADPYEIGREILWNQMVRLR